jgi:hypothetical protein
MCTAFFVSLLEAWSTPTQSRLILPSLSSLFTPTPPLLQFGTVYLGEWRGSTVAIKRMVLPAANNSDRNEKMAIMEAAISSRWGERRGGVALSG